MECWIIYGQLAEDSEDKLIAIVFDDSYKEEIIFVLGEEGYFKVTATKERCDIIVKSGYQ